jgi:hypothetical protein
MQYSWNSWIEICLLEKMVYVIHGSPLMRFLETKEEGQGD